MGLKVLVCGGRNYADYDFMKTMLSALQVTRGPFETIIHGGASGADRLAGQYAERHQIQVWAFPALWEKYGKGAGPVRNKQMIREGKPDIVVAFPGGNGTANMIAQARRAQIPVIEIPPAPTPGV